MQLISFYIIALLYMKISKFKNLEQKQQKLMSEMDDAIGAYLNELKEENDRLIDTIDRKSFQNGSRREQAHEQRTNQSNDFTERSEDNLTITPVNYPVKIAMKSYQSSLSNAAVLPEKVTEEKKKDDRSVAIEMHNEGKSIEEIAKKLGKGKTEVSLLLKFR